MAVPRMSGVLIDGLGAMHHRFAPTAISIESRSHWFERHPAERTDSWAVLADLRVYRATVDACDMPREPDRLPRRRLGSEIIHGKVFSLADARHALGLSLTKRDWRRRPIDAL